MFGMVLNGYDGTIISGLQAFDSWQSDLGYPNGVKLGLLNASGYFAGFLAGPLITWIDETWGRKWGIRFYGVTLLTGSVIGCIAGVPGVNGYALFVTGRAIIGFGLTSFLLTSLCLVQEITHPRNRVAIAHSWDSYWILGNVMANWTVFGTSFMTGSWGWRIPYIIQVPMALYVLVIVQFMPESPRFLIAKGREDEAMQFLVDYHGNGDPNDELVLFEFAEIKEAIRLENEAKGEKWTSLLRSQGNRHRLGLAALFSWMISMSGSSIIYFYYTIVFDLVGITGATTQTGISAGLSVFTWFCQIGAVILGKRVGRRPFMLGTWPMLLLCLIGLTVAGAMSAKDNGENEAAGVATVVLVWLYLGFFNFSNPVLYSYSAEVQTYTLRSKGLLLWNQLSQLFGAYITWVDAIALNAIGWKYYIVYMPLVIIQWCLCYRYMVETYGYTLEEIAQVFDGPESFPIVNRLSRGNGSGSDLVADADVEAGKENPFEPK